MNNLNYTYYNKLVKLLKNKKNLKERINKEKEEIINRTNNSIWGLTNAGSEYLDILDKILITHDKYFNNIRINNIKRKIKKDFIKKIRVVFFCCEYATFPSIKEVYDRMKNDNSFICELVHIPFLHPNKNYDNKEELKEYIKNGYNEIISADEYQLWHSSPDLVIYLKAYDLIPEKYYINEIEKVVDKSIFIPYAMGVGADKEGLRLQFQLPLHEKAWKCISYCKKNYERACEYSKTKGKNFIMIGHPKMDLSKKDFSNDKYYKKIKKIAKGRPIVVYNCHFSIDDGGSRGTFKQFGMDILRYFKNNNNAVLIFRPHPLFKGAFYETYKNDRKFINEYENLINKTENIIYDDTGNYLISMHISNIMVSDMSSLIPEYLIYNKPVIYTKKVGNIGFNDKALEEMLYTCNSIEKITNSFDMLLSGNDPLAVTREKDVDNFFAYDGKVSISEKIIKMITDFYLGGGSDE